MTPRVFALIFTILWTAALVVANSTTDPIGLTCEAISVVAAYVLALHLAYRAIDLGLVPPKA